MSPSSSPCAVTWSWFIKSHNHQSQIRSVFIPDYAILSSDLIISLFVILLSFFHPVVTKFASLFLIIACQKKTLTANISLCNQFPVFICFLKHRIVMFVRGMLCISPRKHISAAVRYVWAYIFIVMSHMTHCPIKKTPPPINFQFSFAS